MTTLADTDAPTAVPDAGATASDPVAARVRRSATAPMMGTQAGVIVEVGPDPEVLLEQLRRLERRWSRFLPDSEISRLGAASGRPVVVSGDTALLVALAVEACRRTGGRFDPTVLSAMIANGYDRDLGEMTDVVPVGAAAPAPGVDGITVDLTTGLIWAPAGVGVDAGGIGKGLAADLVAAAAVDLGAAGALVDVGGDLRVVGSSPTEGWDVDVDHGDGPIATVNLRAGAVATSSVRRRRWRTDHGVRHHVVDPRTGNPSRGPFLAVTVAAPTAWWAEAVATALLVDPAEELADPGAALLDGVGVLATDADGVVTTFGSRADAIRLLPAPAAQDRAANARHPFEGGSA